MAKYWLFDHFTQYIYHFLLICLHGSIVIVNKLKLVWSVHKLYRVTSRKLGQFFKRDWNVCVDPEKLKRIASELSKRPKHLILILMNDNERYIEELSNVALWIICLGTSYITLYSRSGKHDKITQEPSVTSIYTLKKWSKYYNF